MLWLRQNLEKEVVFYIVLLVGFIIIFAMLLNIEVDQIKTVEGYISNNKIVLYEAPQSFNDKMYIYKNRGESIYAVEKTFIEWVDWYTVIYFSFESEVPRPLEAGVKVDLIVGREKLFNILIGSASKYVE